MSRYLLLLLCMLPTFALAQDPHSYANTSDFITRHLQLDLRVSFAQKRLSGSAELQLQRLNPAATELVLDTRDLSITSVQAATDTGPWQSAPFQLGKPNAILGRALHIAMPAQASRVRVQYRTAPSASGLQWLSPAQTAGKRQPFLFTQSQAIHARSWVPLQDTPSVRITYSARIRTPAKLLAVMGAQNPAGAQRGGDYRFEMPQAIPSYLLALAVGDLNFASTGPRSGIYAEPSVLAAAASEFADTEQMLTQAEALYGPYRWGRYDLLILPPSFPFGGMENPRLTFASPTVIVGDKSLVSLVAHELAHSWSGNLVTNASWRDFWLNEGFTSYFTNRIMEAVYGPARGDMERTLEAEELKRDFASLPPAQQIMAPAQASADPEDYASIIAYNRGSLFLYNLELAFGRQRFDAFLKAWFTEHAFTSQTTEVFVAFLNERLLKGNEALFSPDLVQAFIYQAPLPSLARYPSSTAFAAVEAARADWLAGRIAASALPIKSWNLLHWSSFLDGMPASITPAQLAELDGLAQLSQSPNAFLLRSWLPLCIAHHYRPADAAVTRLLTTVGRRYLIQATYEALAATPEGLQRAQQIYTLAKGGYHPLTQRMVEKVLAEVGGY